jgi:hypothetical protein
MTTTPAARSRPSAAERCDRRSQTPGIAQGTHRYRPIPMARSIWSGSINFGHIAIFPHQNRCGARGRTSSTGAYRMPCKPSRRVVPDTRLRMLVRPHFGAPRTALGGCLDRTQAARYGTRDSDVASALRVRQDSAWRTPTGGRDRRVSGWRESDVAPQRPVNQDD